MSGPKFSDVLLEPEWRYVWTDRGVEWVTDRYSMVRTDVLRRHVASRGGLTSGVPTPNRRRAPIFGYSLDDCHPVSATGTTITLPGMEPFELVAEANAFGRPLASGPYYAFNARVLAGLTEHAGAPQITPRRTLIFIGRRRGRAVRAAVLMPVRISSGHALVSAR